MNKKNFLTKSSKVLAGLMVVASVAGPIVANAATLKISGELVNYKAGKWTDSGIEWNPYNRNDMFGVYTMDGQVVWCIEPSIKTDNGVSYNSEGDDAIRNGMTVRTIGGVTHDAGPYFVKRAAFFTWLIYKASDSDISQIKEYVKNKNYSDKFVSNINYVRRLSDDAKWTATQLLLWYTITFVTIKDTDASDPALQDVFKWYATSDGQGIEDELYQPFSRVYGDLEKDGLIEYTGGFRTYEAPGGEQRQVANGAMFKLKKKDIPKPPTPPTPPPPVIPDIPKPVDGFIKVRKEFANLNNGVSNKPTFNPSGIRVGVYSDMNGTIKVGELIIGPSGESNTLKVSPGSYYGYELDQYGNPIRTGAQEVVYGSDATKGYVSGKDKASQNKYVTWYVGQSGSQTPVTATFENMPEVVNFTFKKEIKDPKVAALGSISDQYTRKGAEYTLYSDANATQPVTKNGQPVVAVVDENGEGRFEGLYRGRYWVKESKVPTDKIGRSRYKLDTTIHSVDLSSGDEGETTVTNSTTTITKSFTFSNKFTSKEEIEPSKGSLVIKKMDAETKDSTAQGQATLSGGEFRIEFFERKSLGQGQTPKKLFEAVYRTDDKGEIDVRKRSQKVSSTDDEKLDKMFTAYEGESKEWGAYDYRVTEIKAPNGYKLTDDEKQPKDFVVKTNSDFTWEYGDGSFYNHDLELHLIKTQRSSGDWLPESESEKALISNADFELTNKQTNQKFTAKTDDQGRIKFDGVIAGDYTLRETSVDKYLTNGQVIDLTVEQKDGTTKLTASSTSNPSETNAPYSVATNNDGDIEVKYQNTPKPVKGKLIKANEKGAKLEGAKFKLTHYGEDGTTKVDEKELTTNANGEFEFNELTVGHWYSLEEIEAPDGYKLPANRKTVKFRAESIPAKNSYALSYQISELDKTNENNTTAVTSDVKKITANGAMVDGIKFDANENEGTMALEFDVVNNTWQKLPATGSVYGALAGIAAVVVVVGSLVFYVKKRED